MSNMSKISIIIPVYNHARELARCLQSIKNQNHLLTPSLVKEGGWFSGPEGGLEVVVVNDGSTDVSHEQLCRDAARYVSAVKCIYQPNQGAPIARNNGFKESSGQYVLFCDADVIMKPTMLEKMAHVLDENQNVSYVYSSFKFWWKKFRLWEFDAEKLRQMPYIHTTSLIRREHFPGFDPALKKLQDWDLWLTMLEQGHIGKWIPEVLFSVKTGGTMSAWLPSFLTMMPFGVKQRTYQQAVLLVKQKHLLNLE